MGVGGAVIPPIGPKGTVHMFYPRLQMKNKNRAPVAWSCGPNGETNQHLSNQLALKDQHPDETDEELMIEEVDEQLALEAEYAISDQKEGTPDDGTSQPEVRQHTPPIKDAWI